jgi:hypothetical protein
MDGATGEWSKLHNEELNDLYSLPNILGVVKFRGEMSAACRAYGEGDSGAQVVGAET